ncbi:hypothetical protein ACFUG9_34295 [Streptomyces griseoincarnatus]
MTHGAPHQPHTNEKFTAPSPAGLVVARMPGGSAGRLPVALVALA